MAKHIVTPADIALFADEQRSDKEVTAYLKSIGRLPDYDWAYPKDDHYRMFVLHKINSREIALGFAAVLDAQADPKSIIVGCIKAREIRARIASPSFWGTEPGGVLWAVASARRICCGCHDTGSYHPSERSKRWLAQGSR